MRRRNGETSYEARLRFRTELYLIVMVEKAFFAAVAIIWLVKAF